MSSLVATAAERVVTLWRDAAGPHCQDAGGDVRGTEGLCPGAAIPCPDAGGGRLCLPSKAVVRQAVDRCALDGWQVSGPSSSGRVDTGAGIQSRGPPKRSRAMDALSDVLRAVRLTGGVFLEASFTAPWCVLSHITPDVIEHLMPPPAGIVAFHYVVDGQLQIQIDNEPAVLARAGEMVLLPHNDPHKLASDPRLPPVIAQSILDFQGPGRLFTVNHGGGGIGTRVVCGFLGSDAQRHPLLESLPRVIALRVSGRPGADWIASSFRFAAQEVAAARPGSATVLAKLSELMFVEAVREYMNTMPPERQGWLAALRDPAVGRALALVHARPAHPWTAAELADAVHLSRSAFADRFTHLAGVPPMTYITRWRMQLACAILRESRRSIAQIAAAVGYESEATFARAFKREMRVTPGGYRSGH